MKVVIMAGGRGTRFWPRSTSGLPKQFLALTSERTMIQETYLRFRQWLPMENIYIITSDAYVPLVREQLPELGPEQLIIEPDQRDTGPCIALTAAYFLNKGDDDVLVTTPSDQYVPDTEELKKALDAAAEAAQTNSSIVTLGVVPTRPETGYGYIEAHPPEEGERVLKVKQFIEKPSLEKARLLLQRDGIYWNSGIFIWKPSTIAHYMKLHQDEMWSMFQDKFNELNSFYPDLPKVSVDYAILEKADAVYTIPISFVWDDVGIWTSLERIFQKNKDGNIIQGPVHAWMASCNIIHSDGLNTAVIGVQDLIVVVTKEGLLVCHKSQEQAIKKLVHELEKTREGESP